MAEKPKLLDACREALRIPADCTDFDAEIEDLIEAARAAMRAGGVADSVAADDSACGEGLLQGEVRHGQPRCRPPYSELRRSANHDARKLGVRGRVMSMWAGTCQLIAKTVKKDEYGVQQTEETKRKVFCNVFSMGDAASYAAAAAGVHPEAVLQIRKSAYEGERLVEFDGARLTVARVDRSSPDFVRLTLSEVVGDRG